MLFALTSAALAFVAPVVEEQTSRRALSGECHSWCNVYTCHANPKYCEGCEICHELESGSTCEDWCNPYTSAVSYCKGCDAPTTYDCTCTATEDSCIKPYMKIGSGGSDCGYSTLVGVVFQDPALEGPEHQYSFYSGDDAVYTIDEEMTTAEACQAHCAANPDCGHFYFQYEYTDASWLGDVEPQWLYKCQLSAPFEEGCTVYFDDANEDDEYVGRISAAGPPTCD